MHPTRVRGRARQQHVLFVLYLAFAAFLFCFLCCIWYLLHFVFCTVQCTEAQSQIELGGRMAALGSSVY